MKTSISSSGCTVLLAQQLMVAGLYQWPAEGLELSPRQSVGPGHWHRQRQIHSIIIIIIIQHLYSAIMSYADTEALERHFCYFSDNGEFNNIIIITDLY